MDDKRREIFARLLALSAVREAQIKANPVPFLNDLARENHRLRKGLEDALLALSGADDLDFANEAFPDRPASIVNVSIIRTNKAAVILRGAMIPTPSTGEKNDG